MTRRWLREQPLFSLSGDRFYNCGGVELPEGVVLGGVVVVLGVVVVVLGELEPGRLLGGKLLGGRVLGVTVPVGGHGLATVAEVPPAVPAVPVALGVVLPIPVDELVPALLLVGLEVVLPGDELPIPVVLLEPVVVLPEAVVLQGPTVVVVLLPGVVVPVALGVVVVD